MCICNNLKSPTIYLFVIITLGALLTQTAWRLWERESELDRVYANDTVIQAFDAETNQKVLVRLHAQGRQMNRRWPHYILNATGDLSELHIQWTDIQPLHVSVSSEGYLEQPLDLDQNTA